MRGNTRRASINNDTEIGGHPKRDLVHSTFTLASHKSTVDLSKRLVWAIVMLFIRFIWYLQKVLPPRGNWANLKHITERKNFDRYQGVINAKSTEHQNIAFLSYTNYVQVVSS